MEAQSNIVDLVLLEIIDNLIDTKIDPPENTEKKEEEEK